MKKFKRLTLVMCVNLLVSVAPVSLAVTSNNQQSQTATTLSSEMPALDEAFSDLPSGEVEPESTESSTSSSEQPLIEETETTDESVPEEETEPAETTETTTEETTLKGKRADALEGEKISFNKYVTITNQGYQIWQDFSWNPVANQTDYYQQTYFVKDAYDHQDGQRYYRLTAKDDKEIGLIKASDVTIAEGSQGVAIASSDFVTVISESDDVWQNFNFEVRSKSSALYQKTYRVKEYFNHHNGEQYLSLQDTKGNWQGYLNVKATAKGKGPQGIALPSTDYVTITSKNYNVWRNFSWKYLNKSKNLYQRTFQVKFFYNHHNGDKYLSLYDNQGRWCGYINAKATLKAPGAQGIYISSNDYVTVTSKSYHTWSNFNWKYRAGNNQIHQKTFRAKGYYNHINGSRYLSLYDHKGKWHGYINAKATTKAPGPQGIWKKSTEEVIVNKRNYTIWSSFAWKKRTSSNTLLNQRFYAKGYYDHMNGSRYYSLYNSKGKWQGYINATGVKVVPGAAQFLGTSRKKVVDSLKAHEKDRYYLGTPYRSLYPNPNPNRLLSPRGAPTSFGPGMNCTGFVAHGMRNGGGNLNMVTNSANAWGGISNAYNWRDALKKNAKYDVFNSVSDLLKSGKAKQGDILYFEPDFSRPGYDCHIGFFWGSNAKENKIWHSVAKGNSMGNITSGTPYTKIYLFSLD